MATELGRKWPVAEEGIEFDVNGPEIGEMAPGDIVELHFEADKDLPRQAIRDVIVDTLKIKERYPQFILHYVKIDKRKIVIQYSTAPMEGEPNNPAILAVMFYVLLFIAGLLTMYAIVVGITRGIWLRPPPPTGNASVVAKNQQTGALLPNVNISVSGITKKTGPSGEAVLFKELSIGPHVFVGAAVTGYQTPTPVTDTVIKDQTISVAIPYAPEGWTPPTTGHLAIDTTPVKGEVWVQGESQGVAPVFLKDVPQGQYEVNFGPVEGYDTPAPQTKTVIAGWTISCIGYYTKPAGQWWEKYAKYALIGGGIIIGAAVIIPEVIRAAVRRGEK